MHSHIFRELAKQTDHTDPDQPDELRSFVAIKRLNKAFAKLEGSERAREEVGLGEQAVTALATLRQTLPHRVQTQVDTPAIDRSIITAIPVSFLHDAIDAIHLPNNDHDLLLKLRNNVRECDKAKEAILDRGRLRKLQLITIIIRQGYVTFRNALPGVETETTVHAAVDTDTLPAEGVAFTIRFHLLFELIARSGAQVPKAFRRPRTFETGELAVFRYDADQCELECFYGSTSLKFSVLPKPTPELVD